MSGIHDFFFVEAKIRVKWHLHNNSKLHLLYILYFILLILLFCLFERQWVFDNNVAVLMYSTQQQEKKKWNELLVTHLEFLLVCKFTCELGLFKVTVVIALNSGKMCCHFVYLFCLLAIWWSEVLNNSTNQVILNHFH